MSSGSIFTLLNFKIYYLSNVNYDPAATDLTSIRVTIYLRLGEGGRRAGTGREAGWYGGGRPVRGMEAGRYGPTLFVAWIVA